MELERARNDALVIELRARALRRSGVEPRRIDEVRHEEAADREPEAVVLDGVCGLERAGSADGWKASSTGHT